MDGTIAAEAIWFASYLQGLELEERAQIGREIEQVRSLPGWKRIEWLLIEYRQSVLAEPLSRPVLDHAQYADLFGQVRAIEAARALPQAAILMGREADEELRALVEAREREHDYA
jgi:hypothetical protein